MQKQIRLFIFVVSATFLFFSRANAAISPIAIDIVPPIQFPPSDFTVTGLRVGIVGEHRNMYGIDLAAIGNITDLSFAGLAVSGIFNNTRGTTDIVGLQLAGITNINTGKTNVVGLQVAGAINANKTTSSVVGLNVAVLGNLSPNTSVYGIQVGLYNQAIDIYGFQIGLINNVTNLHGLQLGLINFNEKGLFRVCPIINAGF